MTIKEIEELLEKIYNGEQYIDLESDYVYNNSVSDLFKDKIQEYMLLSSEQNNWFY